MRSDLARSRASPDRRLDPLQLDASGALIRADHERLGKPIRERGITVWRDWGTS